MKRSWLFLCVIILFLVTLSNSKSSDNDSKTMKDGFFENFSIYDICATVAILIGSIVAAGGGLGGGGIFVPVFILIIGLATKSPTPLSQVLLLV